MVGRCKAQPEVTRSEIVNQLFSNARTHPSYDDPKNPTPSMRKTNAFCYFFRGKSAQCVYHQPRRHETNNTCALIRPPQTTRKVALAPRRVCDSRGPGAATSARSLSIILLLSPRACAEPCFSVHHPGRASLPAARLCASSKRSRSHHYITSGQASNQLDLPAVWYAVDRKCQGTPSAPWFLVGVISAQVIRMWPRAWLVPSRVALRRTFPGVG
jgi:hypothetical protein